MSVAMPLERSAHDDGWKMNMSHASRHAKRDGSCRIRRRGVYLVVLAYIEFPGAVASIIKRGYQAGPFGRSSARAI